MKPFAARWCPSRHAAVTEAQGDEAPLTRADLQVFEPWGARERINAAKLPQAAKERLLTQVATAGADRLTSSRG
jgi:hypothetical protein